MLIFYLFVWNCLQQHNLQLNKVERVERGEVTDKDKVTFQLSIEGTTDEDASVDLAEDLLEQEKSSTPRIPVPVALGITVGWIFACAGLFKIWEPDWTYAESCYFMFIRYSKINRISVLFYLTPNFYASVTRLLVTVVKKQSKYEVYALLN